MTAKKSMWTRVKHAVLGAPVTHEEQQAARRTLTRDPMVDAQHQVRSARFTGMHGGY